MAGGGRRSPPPRDKSTGRGKKDGSKDGVGDGGRTAGGKEGALEGDRAAATGGARGSAMGEGRLSAILGEGMRDGNAMVPSGTTDQNTRAGDSALADGNGIGKVSANHGDNMPPTNRTVPKVGMDTLGKDVEGVLCGGFGTASIDAQLVLGCTAPIQNRELQVVMTEHTECMGGGHDKPQRALDKQIRSKKVEILQYI